MERKRTTIQDYRGYLRRHFEPFFGDRSLDRIDERLVAAYLKRKRDDGLSSKTVQTHLNFMHGLFKFSAKRGWAEDNPVAAVERPKKARRPERRLRFPQPVELDTLLRAVPVGDVPASGVSMSAVPSWAAPAPAASTAATARPVASPPVATSGVSATAATSCSRVSRLISPRLRGATQSGCARLS